MKKFNYFTEDVTDPNFDGYDVLLVIYLEDSVTVTGSYKTVFEKVYGFASKNDTGMVDIIAKDIINIMEEKQNDN